MFTFLSCRLDSEGKSLQLTEVTECKEGLESKLEQLNEAHSVRDQQHQGLTADLTQVQGCLQAAEEARASAEVAAPACLCNIHAVSCLHSQAFHSTSIVDGECCMG